MDWSVPKKRRQHAPLPALVAAPIEQRKARAGQSVLGEYRCGTHHELYRYAFVGEARGACHVKAAPGKSIQPHEYMLCPACGPGTAICLTHSDHYGRADAHFREESAPGA